MAGGEEGAELIARAARRVFGELQFPGARRWAIALLIDAAGTGLLRPITVLYFTVHLHLPVAQVGLALGAGGTIALGFVPVAGILIDRLGAKPALLGVWGIEALAYASYAFVRSPVELIPAATFALAASACSSPIKQSLLAEMVQGQQRVRLLSTQRSLRNVGFGLGGLLATLALALGGSAYIAVIFGDAASYLVAIVLILGVHVSARGVAADRPHPSGRIGYSLVLHDFRYMALSALDFFVAANQTALTIALPLWIALHTHAPTALAGLMFTLNTVLVVLFQVALTAGVGGLADAPRAYRQAAALMVLAAAAYLLARDAAAAVAIVLLVAGSALLTGTEMLGSAGEWTASLGLADEHHRGRYLSIFSLGSSLQSAVGVTLVTSILALGSTWLWPSLGVMIAAGCLISARLIAGATAPSGPGASR